MTGRLLPIEPASNAWLHEYTGKTVAVTGAAGFLGSCLVNRLAAVECQIVRVTRAEPLPWDDVSDADVVFHFAAQTSSAAAAENPDGDFAANVAPMRAITRRVPAPRAESRGAVRGDRDSIRHPLAVARE